VPASLPRPKPEEVGRAVLNSVHEERIPLPCARQRTDAEASSEFHYAAPPTMAGWRSPQAKRTVKQAAREASIAN